VKKLKGSIEELKQKDISRRTFVARAATEGLGLVATMSLLHSSAKAEGLNRLNDHHHHDHHANTSRKKGRTWNQTNVNPWDEFLKGEEIPVYRDYHIENLRTLEVKPWKRLGVRGAYIDLVGGEGVNAGYVCEISTGDRTTPQRYLFEEFIYVLTGEGETLIWNPGSAAKQSVKWKAGAIIAPPLNSWRVHINRGREPLRFLCMTNAPVVIDLFHNNDFVFNNDYAFRERFNGEADFFASGLEQVHHKNTSSEESEQAGGVYTWDSGFVPDARNIKLRRVAERGHDNMRVELQMADNGMQAHISEFGIGTYKKAHRHGPGSHVVMLNGKGYTLMWQGSLKYSAAPIKKRIDWVEGSLFVPPDGWFHQHFNTGGDPARYLAPTWGGDGKWFTKSLGGGGRTHRLGKTSTRKGGNLVEYADEDPAIREMFLAELKKNGVDSKMPAAREDE